MTKRSSLFLDKVFLSEHLRTHVSSESSAATQAPSPALLLTAEALALIDQPRPFEEILMSGTPGADQQAVDTVMTLAWAATAWRRTGNKGLKQRLLAWKPVLRLQKPIRIPRFAFENRDLLAGHVLLAFSIMVDVLHGAFDADFVAVVCHALKAQAAQTHADLTDPTAFPAFSYEQNHMIIPVCGLGIAAMTLGDGKESEAWNRFARNFLTRSFEVIARDGWFFEGVGYWNFTMQFPVCYALALKWATGENLFADPPFKDAGLYLAHMVLPDARFVFDFADWGARVEPDGVGFQPGYDLPWHSAPTYVLRSLVNVLAREQGGGLCGRLLARLPSDPAPSALDATLALLLPEAEARDEDGGELPRSHFFPDMGVLHWRSGWDDPQATALAFKSGPPAGHHLASLLERDPAWHLELGHAHPDAGSFLLFAHGAFLANDTGYTGKKETADHNSLLVDGIGQHRGGTPWSTFAAKPYAEYARIRMENVWHDGRVAAGTAVLEAAYDEALRLRKMHRHLILVDGRFLAVLDEMESELPHEYEWRLHCDRPPEETAPGRFVMTNGHGRLISQSLLPVASCGVAPTIVETELYLSERSRPQQRGFHLAVKSPIISKFRFFTAFGIQSAEEDAEIFTAHTIGNSIVKMTDTHGDVTIEIGGERAAFAYLLRDCEGREVTQGSSPARTYSR